MEEEASPPTMSMEELTHHPLHEHPLKHIEKREVGGGGGAIPRCRLCKEMIPSRPMYACDRCPFFLHEYCASLPQQIQHFLHPSSTLCLGFRPLAHCHACFKFNGYEECLSYQCRSCGFIIEASCAYPVPSIKADQILHHSHRHPLQEATFDKEEPRFPCRICRMSTSLSPTWSCLKVGCGFRVHKYCLEKLPSRIRPRVEGTEYLSRGSDCCRGILFYLTTNDQQNCFRCKRLLRVMAFRSFDSSSYNYGEVCVSCAIVAELRPAVTWASIRIHYFLHPCRLVLEFSPFSNCNACNSNHSDFSYRCEEGCEFFLDLGCHESRKDVEGRISHFCHCHPLKLTMDRDDDQSNRVAVSCHVCEKYCLESFYSCGQCDFYIHKFCMDILPQKTEDHLPKSTLILLPLLSFRCAICNRSCASRLGFQCRESMSMFCVKCILWPGGRFKSVHHQHPLTIQERDEATRIRCFMCGEYCSGWTYDCEDCNMISMHKSCAELPRQFKYPFPAHSKHPLTLTEKPPGSVNCGMCMKMFSQNPFPYDGVYFCRICNMYFDSFCASQRPYVQYHGSDHLHLLAIVENMYGDTNCGVCNKSCKDFATLRCVKCEFSVHLLCGPLPRMIKHKSHVHSLVHDDYYVEDNESDEFACHVCEEHRDPRLRVYRCSAGCMMICDIMCVISEVLALFRGERGDVEMITPYPQVVSNVVSQKFLLTEMNLSSTESTRDHYAEVRNVFCLTEFEDSVSDLIKGEIAETRSCCETSYVYSGKEFARFVEQFRATSDFEMDFLHKHQGSVMTGYYQLPQNLSAIYEELLGKYKIIGEDWRLSYECRRHLVYILCCVLHEMRMTKVLDATKEEILKWLAWTKYVEKEGGIDLGFLVDIFGQNWKAHYLIESKRIVDEKSSNLDQNIGRRLELIEELETKLEATKAELRELEVEKQVHNAYRAAGASSLKHVYKNALEIKWRNCYDTAVNNAAAKLNI